MAHYNDIQALRRAFVKKARPFYIVKGKGGDVLFINEEESEIESAGDMLADDLRDVAETSELKIYGFSSVPKTGLLKAKADESVVTTYQKKTIYSTDEKVEYYKNQARGTDPALLELLKEIREDNKALREELAEQRRLQLELAQAEDDEEVEEQAESNGLGAILGNPAVQQILTALVTNIGANMVTQPQQPQPRPLAMAGIVDENPQINALVQKLFDKGLTIDHLQKLADMPAVKIKSLLLML